jgi:uncharacterized protein (DUF1015 family)
MALVFPFRGFRYNKEVVGDLNQVVTQPYDKTSHSMQDEYYQRSPYNVVRITLNTEKRNDPDTPYPEAGAAFRQWIEQKAIIQDKQPAIYAYYHEYVIEGQTRLTKGFIALLDLENSGSGIIPHEHTLAAPKQDRLQLMRSIEGNEDLIYMLYADETLAVDRTMDRSISGRQPEIEVKDEYGVFHRIWPITDPEALQSIQDAMRAQKLFIADGHHRFETSVNFMNECTQKHWSSAGVESFDKRMVACVNSAAGVTILATHRLLRDLPSFDAQSFLQSIEPCFAIERLSTADELWKKMHEERESHVFGFYPAGSKEFYLLRTKPSATRDPLLLKHSEPYRELDVSILHSLILERHLGIDESKLSAQTNIDYARTREVCLQRVDEGKYQAAFLLNPTPSEQMQRIASLGERMPQKSTDFYPKLLTGLVFMQMKIRKS